MADSSEILVSLRQQGSKRERIHRYNPTFKIFICLLMGGVFLTYRFLFPKVQVTCIEDTYQKATENWNRDLVEDKTDAAYEGNDNQLTTNGKVFIGIGQVMMDFWIGTIAAIW